MSKLTADEKVVMSELSAFGAAMFDYSRKIEAQAGTPQAVSLMLFNRLWSNYCGYHVLWIAGRPLEGNIVVRSAVEAAICLSANAELGEAFYPLLLGDLAATLKRMVKIWREMNADAQVRSYEARLRSLPKETPEKPAAFDWNELAGIGGVAWLYEQHRFLSATSAHVTGLSIMRGVVTDGTATTLQTEWADIDLMTGLRTVSCALLTGCQRHAHVIGSAAFIEWAAALEAKFNQLSAPPAEPSDNVGTAES